MALHRGRRALAGLCYGGLAIWASIGVAQQSDAATASAFTALALGLLLAYAALASTR
jgi:hypothetical protein